MLAYALINLKQFDELKSVVQEGLAIYPESAALYHGYGYALKNQDKCSHAVFFFKQAIERNPNETSYYNNMGNCYF